MSDQEETLKRLKEENAGCGCIHRINGDLRERGINTQINSTLFGTPKALIETCQIETGRGKKKATKLLASFCPFCGTEYALTPVARESITMAKGEVG